MSLKDSLSLNDKSPQFYQKYPKLFSAFYPQINEYHLDQLSEAGYLYYHSTLLMDTLIDNKDFSCIPKMTLLQEEAIKILATIYGKDGNFWDCWNNRRKEYFLAVEIEKKLSNGVEVSRATYYDLADKKSAFGKIAIDCLQVLEPNNENSIYQELLLSHKYFSIGFQLYDDVKDFGEDLDKGQFNWAVHQLKQEIEFNNYSNSHLNKLLFIKDIGQKILSEAISNFQKALNILKKYALNSEWKKVVLETKHTIECYLEITNGYIASLKKRIDLKTETEFERDFFDY